jgi:PAS domain S-box-containing protein
MPETSPLAATPWVASLLSAIDDAVILTAADDTIEAMNDAAVRLFGFERVEAIGQALRVVVPLDRPAEDEPIRRAIDAGQTIRLENTPRRRRDGVRVVVSITVVPVPGASGVPAGVIRLFRDDTGRAGVERAARRLAAIVETSDDAIVSKNLDGIVTSWNRSAQKMFGWSAAEMIGESIRKVIPADHQSEEDDVLAKIARGEKIDHFETIRQKKDGTLFPISLTVSPIRDRSGVIIGASKIARDISERKRAEAERARLLALAEQNAAMTARLNQVGSVVASALDREAIVQAVTDGATDLTGAQFGAFFYNVVNSAGESYTLYTISGVPREAFSKFPMPRNTPIFNPTFQGYGVVRSDDITADPRYAKNPPYQGMPPGHLPVRSYLAVPVKSRSGEVLGGLFFGHPDVGVFTEQHERLATGIAGWASIALENARLYDAAQEASRLKDDFLATLSHELRTPLNAILGYARMMRSGILAPEREGKAIETIERNATSLSQIVEDVLDVSRIVSGKMRLQVQPVALPDIVRGAVDGVMPAADARSIRVETILDPQAGAVSGDPERLQQVVWNLMSNAVKFTEKGGKVQVRLEQVNSHVEIIVSDTGVGISPEFLPHIFERFRQADSGTTRERGGLGLGLSIARQLVEMHGGTIVASSAGAGHGSTFRVSLPLMIVDPAPPREPRVHPRAERTSGRVLGLPNLTGVRVLAVDDDRDALGMLRDILQTAGAVVDIADSATAALDAFDGELPDVIVADLGMPRMDGFEFIGRVRQHANEKVRKIPAAALTAYARSEDRAKALRNGFQIHLSKPIDPTELMAAIAALARRAPDSVT